MERNVFLYWVGNEYKLIKILRNIIYLHSTNGKGYKVNLITLENINEYIAVLPDYFYKLCPAHQADYVRVQVICDYGGVWLDSDTLVIESLDSLFDLLEIGDGFFVKEDDKYLCNGVFGSKKQTPLMQSWKNKMLEKLSNNINIQWSDIGNLILDSLYCENKYLYANYTIFNGVENMFPLNYRKYVKELIEMPYENYTNIERKYQPILVLVNSVYKAVEKWTIDEIFNKQTPLSYFIKKAYNNMTHLNDFDFIEIGTSNFDTLIEKATTERGISVDAVKYYIDALPEKPNVIKINAGISNISGSMDVYYIPENVIKTNSLQPWFKGCNSVGKYHPLHIKHNVQRHVVIENVKVITCCELFYQNSVKKLKYLKIDTEGHDVIILDSLFKYLKFLPKEFYPEKILFETNENSKKSDVNDIIKRYESINYKLISRGYDTIIEHKM